MSERLYQLRFDEDFKPTVPLSVLSCQLAARQMQTAGRQPSGTGNGFREVSLLRVLGRFGLWLRIIYASAYRNHSLDSGGAHLCTGSRPRGESRKIQLEVVHTRGKGFLQLGLVVATDTLAQSGRLRIDHRQSRWLEM